MSAEPTDPKRWAELGSDAPGELHTLLARARDTDFMVVCSAGSMPQLRAVRDEIEDKFRENLMPVCENDGSVFYHVDPDVLVAAR